MEKTFYLCGYKVKSKQITIRETAICRIPVVKTFGEGRFAPLSSFLYRNLLPGCHYWIFKSQLDSDFGGGGEEKENPQAINELIT